ncbi:MAG: hypothetical protein NZM35_06585 [Chitinophagales bacterium]|nr:hypothetical protein [Chitinophagales bacterium]MDW8419969.1 hypothetical protein [Chitinophagales bacterium]
MSYLHTIIKSIAGLVVMAAASNAFGQSVPSAAEIATLPQWAQKMYSPHPNVFEVDSLFRLYFKNNPFVKSYHTQYYKRWRRKYEHYINEDGFIVQPDDSAERSSMQQYLATIHTGRASNWSPVGSILVRSELGMQGHSQSNIYCIDQSKSHPNILFCGTEPGEIYKSTNGGMLWQCVSEPYQFGNAGAQNWGSGVSAISIHPVNPNIVFAAGNGGVFRTLNGGATWSHVLVQNDFEPNELLVHPANPLLVFAAANKGLYRSSDGGDTWSLLFGQKSYDIKCNTANSAVMYLVKNSPSLKKCEFFISTDTGATWALQSNGWYHSTDPDRTDGGARIAVTPANPNRIYAYLIGESKANDYGFIGVYRSDDGGQSWTLPNGPAGGPYTQSHPNLAYGSPSWTYHQGFYNCAIMASETDPDKILVGGLSLWRSDDGAHTFLPVAGYNNGPLQMHVDMQDFRSSGGHYWITTDGGIYFSTDFFNTQPEFRTQGIRASDYWGFGSGWNEDVLVGGLYHNGNLAYHENYGAGTFLSLGGGEAATGYVNPGKNRYTYFSDLGGVILPANITLPLAYFSVGKFPNESYIAAESGEMEFHPHCYNTAFVSSENQLWRTDDGGSAFTLIHTFGNQPLNHIKYIEICSSNPQVMYVTQQPASGSAGTLWKTTDGGQNWSTVSIPPGNSRWMLISINPVNPDELWLAYPNGSNATKFLKPTTEEPHGLTLLPKP